jgi:NAD+ kinase
MKPCLICFLHLKETDLVVIVGGDGTLLRTAAFFGDDVPPVLGFRAGNLNYLLHYDLNDDFSLIFQSIFDGDASTTMRSCLSCNLHMANDTGKTYTAVNEVCSFC